MANLGYCGERKITLNATGNKPDIKGIAEVLARNITGGDYAGYLQRLQKEEAQKSGEE